MGHSPILEEEQRLWKSGLPSFILIINAWKRLVLSKKLWAMPIGQSVDVSIFLRVFSWCPHSSARYPLYYALVRHVYQPMTCSFVVSLFHRQWNTPSTLLHVVRVNFSFRYTQTAIDRHWASLGFGKLWISRTRPVLCGAQLISEHATMFSKAFGILIRNRIALEELCNRLTLPGSIGEAVQLMLKQAMIDVRKQRRTLAKSRSMWDLSSEELKERRRYEHVSCSVQWTTILSVRCISTITVSNDRGMTNRVPCFIEKEKLWVITECRVMMGEN